MQGEAWRPREAREERDTLRPIPSYQLLRPAPERDWMVERCFTRGTVAMVSGDGGAGKSSLMQQLLTSACLGRSWLGLATKPMRALMLACEDDDDELHRRQIDINRSLGVAMQDVLDAGLELHSRVGHDNTLSRLDRKEWKMAVSPFFSRLYDRCRDMEIGYVVIDTATQTFAGNQNDEQQVVQYINQLRRLAIGIQGVVIMTKHPSLSGRALGTGESGNTAWQNSVRSRLYLHKDKTKGLVLESRKSNYGPSNVCIPVRWSHGAYIMDEPEPVANSYGYGRDY